MGNRSEKEKSEDTRYGFSARAITTRFRAVGGDSGGHFWAYEFVSSTLED